LRTKATLSGPIFTVTLLLLFSTIFILNTSGKTYGYDESLNLYDKISQKKPIHYAIVGDSIGRGSGAETPGQRWFKILERKMYEDHGIRMFGEYTVQSGATAFEGINKLSLKQGNNAVDLVFIVFGENDRKYMKASDFSVLYESLIRKAKAVYPAAEILTVTESSLKYNDFATEISKISNHYNTAHIDMRPVFKSSGFSEKDLTTDLVHPNGKGYQLYSDTIYKALLSATTNKKEISAIEKSMNKDTYEDYSTSSDFTKLKGFSFQHGYYSSNKKGSVLETNFKGNVLGVKLLRSPDGGMIDVYIDGQLHTTLNTWWPFPRERYIYITNGLSDKKHNVRFEFSESASRDSAALKHYARISSIIVNVKKTPNQ
jgi:lysophospholipase L1-like esterase